MSMLKKPRNTPRFAIDVGEGGRERGGVQRGAGWVNAKGRVPPTTVIDKAAGRRTQRRSTVKLGLQKKKQWKPEKPH